MSAGGKSGSSESKDEATSSVAKPGWRKGGRNVGKLARKFDCGFRTEARPVGFAADFGLSPDQAVPVEYATPATEETAAYRELPPVIDMAYALTETGALYCVSPAHWVFET